ncbi:metal-dependent hydrolase [Salidesulfovibrio onnuriiensis]|uniref:metal-dependent hydrolase n=1 Tax=Salidesulfovibrio onnuriiensis TaxID=2583823 RepID=UPI0011C93ECF|nr:metal-dependent hydrolase [Salidesulfovibrio onnuriiensis]
MPGYKGHIAGGALFGVMGVVGGVMLGYLALDPLHLAGLLGFCLLGAMFPDTDTDSKGQNLYYGLLIVIDAGLIFMKMYVWASWLGLCAMLPALGHHRGWTHTWWAMLLVPLPIVLIPAVLIGDRSIEPFFRFYLAFVLGYFSHLLLDGELY